MRKSTFWPCAMTIAGSDSGGGAGIQADLKTFAALKVHGTGAITCVTAQNPREVTGIEPISPALVRKQIETVFSAFPVKAVKTGMLFSEPIIRTVAATLKESGSKAFLICDPVMVSTSGKTLLKRDAISALQRLLFPLADLITPNIPEAEVLCARTIRNPEQLREAARMLHERHGCAVLAKGGHLKNSATAVDIFYDGEQELLLESPYIRGVSTHGTGCTYSAAICAFCASDNGLKSAVSRAKNFIGKAINGSIRSGKNWVLNSA